MSEFAILAGFFLFVMAGVALAGYAFRGRAAAAGDRTVGGNLEGGLFAEPELPGTQAFFAQALRRVGETVPGAKDESNATRNLLMAAGYRYPSAVPIFTGVRWATALLLALVVASLGAFNNGDVFSTALGALCGGGFGFMLPEFILKRMIRARARRIRRAIPAALDLLILSLESGQSLNQSIVDTGHELRHAHPDLSAELAQVNLELRAGKSRAEALHQLSARNNDTELKNLSSLLIDSERFGTPLGPAMRTHAKHMRTRMRQEAQASARKVGAKLIFPIFFLIFPSVLLVTLGPAVLHMKKNFTEMVK